MVKLQKLIIIDSIIKVEEKKITNENESKSNKEAELIKDKKLDDLNIKKKKSETQDDNVEENLD
jgi:hypothetical protein